MDQKSHWAADALRCVLAVVAGFSIALIAGTVWAHPACDVDRPNEHAAFPCGVILYSAQGNVASSVLAGMARGAGAEVQREFKIVSAAAATVHDRPTLKAIVLSSAQVIPDREMKAIAKPGGGGGTPPPPGEVQQAGATRIGAPVSGNTGAGVGVAIVDTGLDFNHADLSGAIGSAHFDAFGGNAQDQNGHGTHVGGIVGARDNSTGVVGVAPDSTLYAVRVLNAQGSGSDSQVMAGLDWIYSQNLASGSALMISVANMSLGRAGDVNDNAALHDSIIKLRNQGVTVVVAAGNDATKQITEQVPAAYPEVLAIASTTAVGGTSQCSRAAAIQADTASYFTTDGSGVAISAPGEEREDVSRTCFITSTGILSLKLGGGTTRMSGTSMASPHAAGVAALLIAAGTKDPACIRTKIGKGASRPGVAPLNSPTGSYTFDNVREGILYAPTALAASCP